MTTDAAIGHGTIFSVLTALPSTFTTIAEVTSIGPPSQARDAIDATHMNSPEQWREFIGGLKDGGEVAIELNYVPGSATSALLIGEIAQAAARTYRITFVDASVWLFSGIMTGFESEAPVDDKMTATAIFKVTGKPQAPLGPL
ncbi:MAG: hypothetical protein GEU91_18485 [Rhizobiales bacterium]|nr:hypothetical protein [Hyphomicrobiales bacterium]